MAEEYPHHGMAIGFQVGSDADFLDRKSRMVWAWQRKKFERAGWKVDGGIWPRLRMTKHFDIEDYIYGADGEIQGLMAVPLHSDGSYGGIDRGQNTIWGNHNG